MSEIPKVALEMAYQAEGAAAVGEVAWSQDADLALIGLRRAYLAMTAERDAFREGLTGLLHLHLNHPEGREEKSMLASRAWRSAQQIAQQYGCADCAGKTVDDGMICCWGCGRAMSDAPTPTEPQ